MSERAELWRRARATLASLAEDGVDRIGPRPTPAQVAAASPRDLAAARAPASPTPAAQAPPTRRGWQPLVPALEPVELDALGERKAEDLASVREALGECTRCGLCERRQSIVFGEGHPDARVVFVGEGPGADEDRSGRPFVGRAGELLSKMIEAVGWQREQVYICNIVKCRPPANRDPQPEEVAACAPFLERQLLAIQPDAIVTLGKPAIQTLLGRSVAITKARGQWLTWKGFHVMPTFHPAYLLRNYTRETRQAVWDDLRAVRARIDGASGAR